MAISDIKLLEKYMKSGGNSQIVEQNNLNSFESGDRIYPWTNEPIGRYCDTNLHNKKVLSVTSSGDHILHAALAGAKNITGFDINRFCKYYSALKIAMIKTYSRSDFFELTADLIDYELDFKKINEIICNVKTHLSDEEFIFWEKYAQLVSDFGPIVSLYYDGFAVNNAYFDNEVYNTLKKKLYECNIKYIDSGIDRLENSLKEKFDFIYPSNILQCVASHNTQNAFEVLNGLKKILNPNGEVYEYRFSEETWYFKGMLVPCEKLRKEYLDDKIPNFSFKNKRLSRGSICKYKLKGN